MTQSSKNWTETNQGRGAQRGSKRRLVVTKLQPSARTGHDWRGRRTRRAGTTGRRRQHSREVGKLAASFSVRDDPTANFMNIVNTSNSHIDDELRWTEEPLNIVDISVTPNSNHELATWRQTQNVLFCIQFKIQLTKPLSRDSTSEKSRWPDR